MTRPAIRRGTTVDSHAAERASAARAALDASSPDSVIALVPPAREAPLDDQPEAHQRDAQQADDEDAGEHAAGVEVLAGHHDQLADPGRIEEELRRHHPDQPAADRLARSEER